MSRLLQAAKKALAAKDDKTTDDKAKKAAPKVKKVSEDTIGWIFRKVDNVSLNKAIAKARQVARSIGAKVNVNVEVEVFGDVKAVLKRLENVLRTGQQAKRDLAGLADDPLNGMAKGDSTAVRQMLKNLRKSCEGLLDNGSRMVKKIKNAADELSAKAKRQLQTYKTKAQQIEKMFDGFDDLVGQVANNIVLPELLSKP